MFTPVDPSLLLTFRPRWRIWICHRHQTAVRCTEIKAHLRQQHPGRSYDLVAVLEYVSSHHDLIQTSCDPELTSRVPLSLDTAEPLLPVRHDGLVCRLDPSKCRYVCCSLRNMRLHCRTAHGWSEHARRGRPGRTARSRSASSRDPWLSASYQRFFTSGPGSHLVWLRVAESPASSTHTADESLSRLLDRHRDALQTGLDPVVVPGSQDHDPWLLRTGWPEYLAGQSRTRLMTMLEPPNPSDDHLWPLWRHTARLFAVAEATLARSGHFARHAVVQIAPDRTIDQPLRPYQTIATLEKGIRTWQQLVTVIVRSHQGLVASTLTFRLTPTQRGWLEELWSQAVALDEESVAWVDCPVGDVFECPLPLFPRTILALLLSLLDGPFCRQGHFDSALVGALAVLGLDRTGWRRPDTFTSSLSGLLKLSRYLVIRHAWEEASRDLAGSGPDADYVRSLTGRFLSLGTFSPFEYMWHLRSYGLGLSRLDTRVGYVSWSGTRLHFRDVALDLPAFQTAIRTMTIDLDRLLRTELLLGLDPPSFDLGQVQDYLAQDEPQFSFLVDPRNRTVFPSTTTSWLAHAVFRTTYLHAQWLRHDDDLGPTLDATRIDQYLRHEARFRALLAVLVHLTAGQPARVPELLSVRHRNSDQGEHRGVFVDHGLVCLATSYYKGSSTARRPDIRLVLRFLPRAISEILVRFLILVLPWVEQLRLEVLSSTRPSSLLWPDEEQATTFGPGGFSSCFRRTLQKYLGVDITVQNYRHLAIAIVRRYSPSFVSTWDVEDASEDVDDLEGGRTTVFDAQAAHSTTTAEQVYARDLGQLAGDRATQHLQFRRASEAWHAILSFSPPSDLTTPSTADLDDDVTFRRWQQFRTASYPEQFRLLYGPRWQLRPAQDQVLAAIHAGTSPLLAVMATGAGKSVLFFLPASYDFSSTTVVVIPLVGLRDDLSRRARALNLSHLTWDSTTRPRSGVRLVFCTPEAAITEDFFSYLTWLRTTQQLDRIVFDECHVFLTETGLFRPAIHHVRSLLALNVRLLFLSATLPVSREKEFWGVLGLDQIHTTTLRSTIHRPNLSYEVLRCPLSARVSLLREIIAATSTGKIIIYAREIASVTSLATELGVELYHAQLPGKEAALERFRASDRTTIVATTALGQGLDIPDIRVVIHLHASDGLIEYLQESGRAGRDGELARCLFLLDLSAGPRLSCHPDLVQYLQLPMSTGCRRTALLAHFDGIHDQHCGHVALAGCVPCDLCRPRLSSCRPSTSVSAVAVPVVPKHPLRDEFSRQHRQLEAVREHLTLVVRTTALEQDHMVEFLHEMCQQCGLCRGLYGVCHVRSSCPHPSRAAYEVLVEEIRGARGHARYSSCYFCGLPQSLCARWTSVPGASGALSCSYEGRECFYEAAPALFFPVDDILIQTRRTALWARLGVSEILKQSPVSAARVLAGRRVRWLSWPTNLLFRATIEWFLLSSP